MKKTLIAALALCLGMMSCKKDELPGNPVVDTPVPNFVVTINGTDYTVAPKGNDNGTLNDTMYVTAVRADKATVKTFELKDPAAAASIKAGDALFFEWDVFPFTIGEHRYYLKLNYSKTTPDVAYVVQESENFYVDLTASPKLASILNDYKFEGYADLSGEGTGKIGIANSFRDRYYGTSTGFTGSPSYGTFALQGGVAASDGKCPSPGPASADWNIGKGYWKMNYNALTGQLEMLNTVWAIDGTATGGSATNMAYDGEVWIIDEILLEEGEFNFTTVPVTAGDPVIVYLQSTGTSLSEEGVDIAVSKAGTYEVKLDLRDPGKYKYTLTDKNIEPPKHPYLYVVSKPGDDYGTASSTSPLIYDVLEDGNYEGYVYLGDPRPDWSNLAIVDTDKNTYYSVDGGFGSGKYGSFTLAAQTGIQGPWAPWHQGNSVWRITYNYSSKALTTMLADFGITGTATGNDLKPLTYDDATKKWTAEVTLAAGEFKFQTAPVSDGTSNITVTWGDAGTGDKALAKDGAAITVSEAAVYTVTLDMTNTIDLKYNILKEGDAPDPDDADYMYLRTYAGRWDAFTGSPKIYDLHGNGLYEGYLFVSNIADGDPMYLVDSDQAYLYTFPAWQEVKTMEYKSLTFTQFPYVYSHDVCCPAVHWATSNKVWKLSFNTTTNAFFVMQTNWNIAGTATGDSNLHALTHNTMDDTWSVTMSLVAGSFKFETAPATLAPNDRATEPVGTEPKSITLGVKSGQLLQEDGGTEIAVTTAGSYTITLDLKDGSYKYSMTAN